MRRTQTFIKNKRVANSSEKQFQKNIKSLSKNISRNDDFSINIIENISSQLKLKEQLKSNENKQDILEKDDDQNKNLSQSFKKDEDYQEQQKQSLSELQQKNDSFKQKSQTQQQKYQVLRSNPRRIEFYDYVNDPSFSEILQKQQLYKKDMKNISDCIRVPGAINKFKFDFGNDDNAVTSRSMAQLIMFGLHKPEPLAIEKFSDFPQILNLKQTLLQNSQNQMRFSAEFPSNFQTNQSTFYLNSSTLKSNNNQKNNSINKNTISQLNNKTSTEQQNYFERKRYFSTNHKNLRNQRKQRLQTRQKSEQINLTNCTTITGQKSKDQQEQKQQQQQKNNQELIQQQISVDNIESSDINQNLHQQSGEYNNVFLLKNFNSINNNQSITNYNANTLTNFQNINQGDEELPQQIMNNNFLFQKTIPIDLSYITNKSHNLGNYLLKRKSEFNKTITKSKSRSVQKIINYFSQSDKKIPTDSQQYYHQNYGQISLDQQQHQPTVYIQAVNNFSKHLKNYYNNNNHNPQQCTCCNQTARSQTFSPKGKIIYRRNNSQTSANYK